MKPYQKIPIKECGEPLVAIPPTKFVVESPHAYEKLGAEYEGKSPYCLRQGVLEALETAQFLLEKRHPGWKLKIHDAYRPLGVQQFMVNYTFESLLRKKDWREHQISAQQRQEIWSQVYEVWAAPTADPNTPPPHSTGSAVDLTIIDNRHRTLNMGGEIDEISPRSHPDYYANSKTLQDQQYNRHRQLLNKIMIESGFCRHPKEWWHFSLGDQMWAWLQNQKHPQKPQNHSVARYGKI
ncbi:MAG: M15 family metallopeptidase [Xenococcus sp. (in: cyanobacteria)]